MRVVLENEKGERKEFSFDDMDVQNFIDENWEDIETKLLLAMKAGVNSIKASSTSINTDYVEKEFNKLQKEFENRFKEFQETWDRNVREVFGDDFRKMKDSIDPKDPRSPTGELMERLDIKVKEMFREMDPADELTPLGKLRIEMLRNMNEVMKELKSKRDVEDMEQKTTLKGLKYEDVVFEKIHEIGSTMMDNVDSTGAIPGIGSSKKGDIVSELHGYEDLKIAMEVKDSGTLRKNDKYYKSEIQAAMENRGAIASMLIAHPTIYPFDKPMFLWRENTVVCRYDPDIDDTTILEVAYQLIREIAVRMVKEGPREFSLKDFEVTINEINIQAMNLESIEKKVTRSITNLGDIRDELNKTKTNIRANIQELINRINEGKEE